MKNNSKMSQSQMSAHELETVVGGIQKVETLELEPLPAGGLFTTLDGSMVDVLKKTPST